MGEIQRGLVPLLEDLDRRARPGRPSRNRPLQRYVSVTDTVVFSSDTQTVTTNTGAYQFTKQSYRTEVMADSPLHYWRMGENAPATHVNDDSSQIVMLNAGSALYGYLAPGNSEPNRAAQFTGSASGSYFNSTGFSVSGTSITLEFWVNPDSLPSTSPFVSTLFGNQTDATNSAFVRLGDTTSSGNGRLQFLLSIGGGFSFITAATSNSLSTGTWYHVVALYDGSTMQMYVNASAVTTGRSTSGALSSTNAFYIGAGAVATTAVLLDGYMDECAVYSAALTTTRVDAHYTAMTNPTSPTNPLIWGQGQFKGMRYRTEVLRDTPALYWRCGEYAPAATANDTSTGDRYGSLGTGVLSGATGAIVADPNTAFAFTTSTTGSSGRVTLAASTFLSSTGFVFETWVLASSSASVYGIIEKTIGGVSNTQADIIWNTSQILFRTYTSTGGANTATFDGVSPNTWYHVVGLYDGSTQVIYVNGTSGTAASPSSVASSSGVIVAGALVTSNQFAGRLDEIAIYTTPHTTARIYERYLAGTVSS